MNTVRLYEIAESIRAIVDYAGEDQLTDGAIERLEALEMSLEDKAAAICAVVRERTAEAEAFQAEADRLEERAKSLAADAARLKEYLKFNLEALGIGKLPAGLFTVRVQRNGQPSIKVSADVDDLPTWAVKIEKVPDRTELLKRFKAGEPLPAGVEVNTGTHLRIT